jgi:hypothetical protein
MADNTFTQETDMAKIIQTDLPWNSPHWHPAHGGIYRNVYLHVTDPLHISLPLYRPAAAWTKRLGPGAMIRLGFLTRLVCLIVLSVVAVSRVAGRGLLSELAFAAFVLAWAILSVGGTALAARRSPIGEGGGIGLFNAASAAAGVLGAVLAGWVANAWGYHAVPLMGVACVACGLAVAIADPAARRPRTAEAAP